EQRAREVARELHRITLDPVEILEAPRIGVDCEADDWVREHFAELASESTPASSPRTAARSRRCWNIERVRRKSILHATSESRLGPWHASRRASLSGWRAHSLRGPTFEGRFSRLPRR